MRPELSSGRTVARLCAVREKRPGLRHSRVSTAGAGKLCGIAAPTLQAALYTLAPVAATVGGGALAAWRPPGRSLTSVLQHAAAGVVFAAVAVEVIPELRTRSAAVTIVGFAAGIAAMLGLQAIERRVVGDSCGGAAAGGIRENFGLIAVTAVDLFIDGLVLGAGFAVGSRQGILLAVALTLELLFLGVSTAAALASGRSSQAMVLAITSALALLPLIGAVAGAAVLGRVSQTVVVGVLAFGAVALMYLVTEELLVEAHEVAETAWATAVFFVGFLVYLVIAELVG